MTSSPENQEPEYWQFSLRVYDDEEARATLLWLQDHLGLDINLVLLAAYYAAKGRRIDVEAVASADGAVSQWRQEAINPLRAARRSLKAFSQNAADPNYLKIYKDALALELRAEYIAQSILDKSFASQSLKSAAMTSFGELVRLVLVQGGAGQESFGQKETSARLDGLAEVLMRVAKRVS